MIVYDNLKNNQFLKCQTFLVTLLLVVIACGTTTTIKIESTHKEETSCKELPSEERLECEKMKHEERMKAMDGALEIVNNNEF